MLIPAAAVMIYDNHSLIIIRYNSLETSSVQLSITNKNQAMRIERPIELCCKAIDCWTSMKAMSRLFVIMSFSVSLTS